MAIYAVQGFYAAGCIAMAYRLYKFGLNPSFLANHTRALIPGDIKDFIDSQAKKMGLEKEIVVIQGKCHCSHSYGNTWFSGMVGIELSGKCGAAILKFNITHKLAQIKANDNLTRVGAALAATLFTTLVLAVNRDLFTGYLGGLGAGLITKVVLSRRAEKRAYLTAMQFCSKEVNQAYLDRLLEIKQKGSDHWILCKPSLDERIGYFRAHIQRAI